MQFNRAIPAAKITFPLILGILVSNVIPITYWEYAAFFTFAAYFLTILLKNTSQTKRFFSSLLVYTFLISTGSIVTHYYQSNHTNTLPSKSKYFKGTLLEIRKNTDSTITFEYLVDTYKANNGWHSTKNEKVVVRCKKASQNLGLQEGNQYFIKGYLQAIRSPKSPHDVDFKTIYAKKNIHHFLYTNQKSIICLAQNENWLHNYKTAFIEYLFTHLNNKHAAFISALIANEKTYISDNTKKLITENGISHLIAISGLHIGIIYLLFVYFSKKIPHKHKVAKTLYSILTCAFLIIYGLFCGFSPSIARSITMFCVMEIASIINRKNNSINSLFVAAFFILIMRPTELYSVGFQLSFGGVLGILLFYKQIKLWCSFKHLFFQKTWEAFAVTLSAQLGVLPLLIYYFKKFSLNSVFLSVALTLLTSFLVSSGMLLLLTFKLPAVNFIVLTGVELLTKLFFWILDLSNMILISFSFEQLNLPQVAMIYITTISCFHFIKFKTSNSIKTILFSAIFLYCYQISMLFINKNHNELFIYSDKNNLIIEQNGHITEVDFTNSQNIKNKLLAINNELILIQNTSIPFNHLSIKTLVLSKEISMDALENYHAEIIVFNQNIRSSYIKKVQRSFDSKAVALHRLKYDGFFEAK